MTEIDKAIARTKRVENAKMYIAGLEDEIEKLEREIEPLPEKDEQTNMMNIERMRKRQQLNRLKMEYRNNENAVLSATVDPDDIKKVFG